MSDSRPIREATAVDIEQGEPCGAVPPTGMYVRIPARTMKAAARISIPIKAANDERQHRPLTNSPPLPMYAKFGACDRLRGGIP